MNNNDFADVSIDLETLGTHVTAPIIAIGLSFFNKNGEVPDEKDACHIKIDPREYIGPDAGWSLEFEMEYDTLAWWMKQENALIEAYFNAQTLLVKEGVLQAFQLLEGFEGRVWGNGPSFDCTILAHALRVCGHDTPWKFWMERDVRTIVEAANTLSGAMLARVHEGMAHNAMDDAISQAGMVQMAHRSMMQEAHGTKITQEEAAELLGVASNPAMKPAPPPEPTSWYEKIVLRFIQGV